MRRRRSSGFSTQSTLYPPALFEAIQERVERIDVELQLTCRPRLDQLAKVIAVPRACIEQRQNQQLCRASLEFAIERSSVDI